MKKIKKTFEATLILDTGIENKIYNAEIIEIICYANVSGNLTIYCQIKIFEDFERYSIKKYRFNEQTVKSRVINTTFSWQRFNIKLKKYEDYFELNQMCLEALREELINFHPAIQFKIN